ncbi:MAG: leucyl/phenylalanyl-tRNA--protein transferase [Gammaproteobacteria bacterium]
MSPTFLDPNRPDQPFPPVQQALEYPNGLLAIGGCLSPQRIVNAYKHGIFPWYNPGEPFLWWSPNPRLVLFPDQLSISRSLGKTIRKQHFTVSFDADFAAVLKACAETRKAAQGTWITREMQQAYTLLHRLGIAHSVEAWQDGQLAGGLYGLALGRVFFGESMFYRRTDASKVAFVQLVQALKTCGYRLIDCQVRTEHLLSLGAEEIPRAGFVELLNRYCTEAPERTPWPAK